MIAHLAFQYSLKLICNERANMIKHYRHVIVSVGNRLLQSLQHSFAPTVSTQSNPNDMMNTI